MSSKLLSLLTFINLTFTINFLFLFQPANGNGPFLPENFYNSCGNSFSCGNTTGIRYPFSGILDPAYCGHPGFTLECHTEHNITMIEIMNSRYYVLGIDENTQTLRIIRPDILERSCPYNFANTTLDFALFDYTAGCTNYTFLYGCPDFRHPGLNVPSCGNGVYVVGGNQGAGNCETSVIVPVLHNENTLGNQPPMNGSGFDQVLRQGFEIRWKIDGTACRDCEESNGRCGFDIETNQMTCLCHDPPFVSNTTCPTAHPALPPNAPSPGTYYTSHFCT